MTGSTCRESTPGLRDGVQPGPRAREASLRNVGTSGRRRLIRQAAARELRSVGSLVRKPSSAARPSLLTTHESQIAQLVAQGLTNSEVAHRMFLSARTVQYHLAKVFDKLEVRSPSTRHAAAQAPSDLRPARGRN